jgi:hypothetical protein
MVIQFKDKEVEYKEWCDTHKDGYVFNMAGGPTGNVLHVVSCWHLKVPSRKGTYTTRYPKYCSNNLNDLMEVVEEISKPNSWRECTACFKNTKGLA